MFNVDVKQQHNNNYMYNEKGNLNKYHKENLPHCWIGWLVVFGLMALSDSISAFIEPSSREMDKEKKLG